MAPYRHRYDRSNPRLFPFDSKPKRRLATIESTAKSQAMIQRRARLQRCQRIADPISRGSRVTHRSP
jgi:hypothetical protein